MYDVEADPWELTNLAGQPGLRDVQSQLRKQLDGWMAQQGDRGVETELQAQSRQMSGPE